jgi:HEAT repeat protein
VIRAVNNLSASDIIQALEAAFDDVRPVMQRITEEASSSELLLALEQATNAHTRELLVDIAGNRFERDAVPALIRLLQDEDSGVQSSAADALGKIGDVRAGPALLECLMDARQPRGARQLLASALGAVGYRPAFPELIECLNADDDVLRGTAAWGLGIMGAVEAVKPLRAALERETEPPGSYTRDRLEESAEALELMRATVQMKNRRRAIAMLMTAIHRDPWIGVRTTSAALALGQLRAHEARELLEHLLAQYPQGFLATHLSAALRAIDEPARQS